MPMLMGPPNRACYKHTCRIQQCLSENNYDSRSCAWAIEALKRCCEMPFAAHSIHCAFPDLNRQQPVEENTTQKKEESAAEEKNVTQPSSKGKETEERIGGSKADAPG
ncbi:hypothetical protein Ndes2437A_g06629 [Nannochloris sp. 'desiccata']